MSDYPFPESPLDLIWVRRPNGRRVTPLELIDALGEEGPVLAGAYRDRLMFADRREAWRAGPGWVVGFPRELVMLFDLADDSLERLLELVGGLTSGVDLED